MSADDASGAEQNADDAPRTEGFDDAINDALKRMESVSPVSSSAPIEGDLISRRVRAEELVQVLIVRLGLPPDGVMPLAQWRTRLIGMLGQIQAALPTTERFNLAHALAHAEQVTSELIAEVGRQRARTRADVERAGALAVEQDLEGKRLLAEAARAQHAHSLGALHGMRRGFSDIEHLPVNPWVKLAIVAIHTGLSAVAGDTGGGSPDVTPPSHRIGPAG